MGWKIEAGRACHLCQLTDCFSRASFMQVVPFVGRDMRGSYLFCGLHTQQDGHGHKEIDRYVLSLESISCSRRDIFMELPI